MIRRHLTRRAGLVGGALACFAVSVMLFLLAADVVRWRDALSAGDVHYRVAPQSAETWQPDVLVAFHAARALLGVQDDVEFRRAVHAFANARLEEPTVSDPEVALLRNEAQARLEAIAGGDGDRVRRSRAAGLLGVLGLARLMSETQDRETLLEIALTGLQLAIALDPGNGDAKFNLELALQRGRGIDLAEAAGGAKPSPGGAGARGAGAGEPGSGY